MIHSNRIIMVGENESTINSPIILYRGDGGVEVEFSVIGHKFTFTQNGNVIKSVNATYGQLVIITPSKENIFSEVTACRDGKIVFVITKEMIDEIDEVGFYDFQIRLFDENKNSRVTIPPVLKGTEIREPIVTEEASGIADMGSVNNAVVRKERAIEELVTFLEDGNYNKTDWKSKDIITEAKLNKIEDALYTIVSILLRII